DLYGALGSPVRMCRTVVVGRRRELVQRVLYVLSYFIRCSDLQEHVQPQGQKDNPANPCSSQTTDPTPEKTFPPKPDSLNPTACVIGISEKALNSELGNTVPGTCVEQNDETLLTDAKPTNPSCILESSTSTFWPIKFHIGSPRESESEGQAGGLTGAGKLHHRVLTDIRRNESSDSALGDSDDEETSLQELYMATEQKEY
ncbi:hypothetical protein M9458_001987, partial [Cirrhinus mrigala]